MSYSYCEFEPVVLADRLYTYVSIDGDDKNRSYIKDGSSVYSVLTAKLLPEYVYDRNRNS